MLDEICPEKIDWEHIGKRLKKFRELLELDKKQFADMLGIGEGNLSCWENGMPRKTIGVLPVLCHRMKLNFEWVLTGTGHPFNKNDRDIVDPLKIDVGSGIRKSDIRKDCEDGIFNDDLLDFVKTVDHFKAINKKPFPTLSELYTLMLYLGYRKVEERSSHLDCTGD